MPETDREGVSGSAGDRASLSGKPMIFEEGMAERVGVEATINRVGKPFLRRSPSSYFHFSLAVPNFTITFV